MHRASSATGWVRNPDGTLGWIWNPLSGCLNHTPEGLCLGGMFPCYAFKLANGRLRQRYLANKNVAPYEEGYEDEIIARCDLALCSLDPFYPRFWEERLYHPWGGGPKGIFICDMSDLFGQGIPEEWTRTVLDLIRSHDENRYYLLTKQPQNLIKFSPFPSNCWVGVTVTSNGAMTLALTNLANIQTKVRYISFEPLLGSIGMSDHMSIKGVVDWVIIGACTGAMKDLLPLHHRTNLAMIKLDNKWTLQPQIEWLEEIVNVSDKAGVKVFLKDNLKPLLPVGLPYYKKFLDDAGNTIWRLRQEMPKGGKP